MQQNRDTRGRKPMKQQDFLSSKAPISFSPVRETREQMLYIMREKGIITRSVVLAMAVKHLHDHLIFEAQRKMRQVAATRPVRQD